MSTLLLLSACIGLSSLPSKDSSNDGAATADDTGGSTSVGSLDIDASAIAFGSVAVDAVESRDLTLSNSGGDSLGVTLSVSGDAFSVSTESVSIDTDTVVTVSFAPETEGPYEGTLLIAVDGGDSLSLPLTGTGEGPEDPPDPSGALTISPARYDFGQVDIDGDETTTFTVTNTGDDDLLISDVTTSAGVWTTGGTLSPPQVLSPGSNKLLEVTFAPTAETTYTGLITLHSDSADDPEVTIAVEGEGVDLCDVCTGVIEVDTGADPYAITDFFSLFSSSDTRTITIQNVGDMELNVTDVSVNNDTLATCGSFTLGGWTSARTLAPWATTSFTISYRATSTCLEVAQSAFDANVAHILSDDPTQRDYVIELSGAGL